LSSADSGGPTGPEDETSTTAPDADADAAPAEQEASPAGAVSEPEPEPEPEPDPVRQPLVDMLRERLGDALLGSEVSAGDIWVRVERSAWRTAGEVCKRDLGMDYFCFLSGMDWLPSPDLSAEKLWDIDGPAEPKPEASAPESYETGLAGGQTRFQVFARLFNTTTHVGITLKADLDDVDPRVESWIPVYRGADWHERECWEMYGFQFDGHPDLRHLYLPAEFEGHPQRKDFPLLAREVKPWPGLVDKEPIPGEEEEADATAGGET
jgi:NADH-quinone oxidoreductase subunit C